MNGEPPSEEQDQNNEGLDVAWLGMFHQLVFFKSQTGHCLLREGDRKHARLAAWLRQQGDLYHKQKLPEMKQRELEALGVEWDLFTPEGKSGHRNAKRWEERYIELLAFKEKHGHLHVTKKNQLSAGQMHWRDNQRLRFQSGVMHEDEKQRLDAIGFEWENPERWSPAKEEHNVILWESMFEKLLAFREVHGHCQVSKGKEGDEVLAKWVQKQRMHQRNNALLPERRQRLEEIGFAWKSDKLHFTDGWEGRYAELVAFKEKHGHLHITKTNQLSAGQPHWRDNQRLRFKSGVMSDEQKAKLEAIGFEWENPQRLSPSMEEHNVILWESMFERLLAFRAVHGHCQVSNGREGDEVLAKWVQRQRMHQRNNALLPERRQRLEEIGFAWKSDRLHFTDGWEGRYAELLAFKEKHGHLRVTRKNQLSEGQMHWRDNQRLRFKSGVMSDEQKAKLEAIGFEWENPERLSPAKEEHNVILWESMFEKLLAFRAVHGHCQVQKCKGEDEVLAKWVQRQRTHKRNNALLPERQQRLEEIGFAWKSDKLHLRDGWEGRYAELLAFKEKHGHLRVTKTNQLSAGQMHWSDNQRLRFQNGAMSEEQKAKLDAIGFDFEPPSQKPPSDNSRVSDQRAVEKWERRYARLTAFQRLHGHANVPGHPDRELRKWVLEQRLSHAQGDLDETRVARLEELGFVWELPAMRRRPTGTSARVPHIWEQRFEELQAFVATHGHFRVPKKADEFKLLRQWVVSQRVYRRKGCLREAHLQKLDAIGFPWDPGKDAMSSISREDYLRDLAAFKERHGHTRVPHHRGPDMKLGGWLLRQRRRKCAGRMEPDLQRKLDALGVEWNPSRGKSLLPRANGGKPSSDVRMNELRDFHAIHGHANAPTKNAANQLLGNWVSNTRISYKKGQLSAQRIQELEALGFSWHVPRNAIRRSGGTWETRFAQLVTFKETHGHMKVSVKDPVHSTLAHWLFDQRKQHRKGRLLPDKLKRLKGIGVRFSRPIIPPDYQLLWEQHFPELLEFRSKNSHPHVSKADKAHLSLEKWAKTQRYLYRKRMLSAEHIQSLESIGFQWSGREAFWQRQVKRWLSVSQSRRTRQLTINGSADDDLAKWEQIQRSRYLQGRLSEVKASMLRRCGLVFQEEQPFQKPGKPVTLIRK
jgi:hypothetical protein